nr:DNAse I-like superfamily protein [Tanacetum cinerariifolium]
INDDSIDAKNKLKIVTSEHEKPTIDSVHKALGKKNDMITSWILNTIDEQIDRPLALGTTSDLPVLHYTRLGSLPEDLDEECDEGNSKEIWGITIEDAKRLKQTLTPPDHTYDALVTDSILDELLAEFRDEILDITMVDKEADCNPSKDIKELERLLLKDP